MNSDLNSLNLRDSATELHPYYEGQAAPIQPPAVLPVTIRKGKDLILVNGAEIASSICLKSGRPVKSQIDVSLRNPFKPSTWFGTTHKAVVGLSREDLQSHKSALTVAWLLIAIGAVLVGLSFYIGLLFSPVGIFIIVAGIVIRSMSPVWSPKSTENSITIRGCGRPFLGLFPGKD